MLDIRSHWKSLRESRECKKGTKSGKKDGKQAKEKDVAEMEKKRCKAVEVKDDKPSAI